MFRQRVLLFAFAATLTAQLCATEWYLNVEKIINDLFTEVSGFRIPEDEKTCIREAEGDPTYGEILPGSVSILIDLMNLKEGQVFCDFGCGVGKFVLQIHIMTPADAEGVELSETRCKCARDILKPIPNIYDTCIDAENSIRKTLKKPTIKKVKKKAPKIIEGNILDQDFGAYDAAFACATCFSEKLMQKMQDKWVKEGKEGSMFITLKQFPGHEYIKLVETYTLPMTWSKTTPVYVYRLSRKKVKEPELEVGIEDLLAQEPGEGEEVEEVVVEKKEKSAKK